MDFYKNVVLCDLKTLTVEDRTFKYQILTYEANSEYYEDKYQKAYIWTPLDKDYIFTIELDATDTEITENTINGFLNINVEKNKRILIIQL